MKNTTPPTIEVCRGDSVSLSFMEAASGGYEWTAEQTRGLFINKIRGDKTATNEAPAIGGAIKAKFMIVAESAGEYELTFTHKRPWEDAPIESYSCKIRVV